MIEIETFLVRPEVEEVEFLAADRRVQTEWAPFRPGFIRRTLARGAAPGEWAVITLWGSVEAADQSRAELSEAEIGRAFLATMVPASFSTLRYHEIQQ